MKVYICITGDYEPSIKFNWKEDVIKPTEIILKICEDYNANYSIFFDVCTTGVFKEVVDKNQILKVFQQVKTLILRGHDVQLHLHQHWLPELGSELRKEVVNEDLAHFRLQSLPIGNFEDRKTIRGLFKWGVRTLEDMIKPVKPDYAVTSFRAGGYCIQPSQDIVKVMREVGILADSSVWFGGYKDDGVYYYDFRKAPSKYQPYYTTDDVLIPSTKNTNLGVIEFPIASMAVRNIKKLFLAKSFSHVELCQFGKNQIKRFLLQFKKELEREDREHNFLTVTSHPKGLKTTDGFRCFLESAPKLLNDVAEVRFVTMSEAVKLFYNLYPMGTAKLSEQQLNTLRTLKEDKSC